MARSEGSRRTFAMNKKVAALASHRVGFELARVVRDIEKKSQLVAGKKVVKHAPCVVAENFAVGQRTIDGRAHGSEIAVAEFRSDWRACEIAVGQIDPEFGGGDRHFLEVFAADLMAQAA